MVTGGAATSQVRVAGVASALPARSTARTRNVCSPGSSSVNGSGELHASNGAPSSEHSYVRSTAGVALSEAVNSNVVSRSPTRPAGPASSAVPGAVSSGTEVHS